MAKANRKSTPPATEPAPASFVNPAALPDLYAGRLSPEKGVYTLLSALHVDVIADDPLLTFTVTTAGADKPQGAIIEAMLRAHPRVDVVDSRKTPAAMSLRRLRATWW